ncbi:Hsp70 family protein [Chitinasiproducens palmae]|uniref:Hypothetical chaperone protein n=1 Tax=Chitinasiproducens palmae TaxID=1770053 RepID=A0A1H2PTI4_9BURK|nr:Hsp70 family protein [Chitinasiproducens palmae]SDV50408.1 hypothetical chaperone protein [Chitinasiproducens palmae]
MTDCAIDFGTSNSAVAVAHGDGVRLVDLEAGQVTMPSAIFFNRDEGGVRFGRAAVADYVAGYDGRLMRGLKSILGSSLAEGTTELGEGEAIAYLDVITLFLRHLLERAASETGAMPTRAVLGRPAFFVDDDPAADARAQAELERAARAAGLREIHFQYEPIAAAFDYERRVSGERIVLVADIGGGTSDFSVIRVGPARMARMDRRDDLLAHGGVHVAGTDFDRRAALDGAMREFGYRTIGTDGREVPNRLYFDLATWHLINTVYGAKRLAGLRDMRTLYTDARHPERLQRILSHHLGHEIIGRVEQAKIDVAGGGATQIDLSMVESGLAAPLDDAALIEACRQEVGRIVAAAQATVRDAQLGGERIDALYLTGGSTGLAFLSDALSAAFPGAERVSGDRLGSVATGLGVYARRLFG